MSKQDKGKKGGPGRHLAGVCVCARNPQTTLSLVRIAAPFTFVDMCLIGVDFEVETQYSLLSLPDFAFNNLSFLLNISLKKLIYI
jgi:hypothetical protein